MSTIVLVDGPNLINGVFSFFGNPNAGLGAVQARAEYFAEWFDVDRFVQATLPQNRLVQPFVDLGIVIVHSLNQLGKPENAPRHIEGGKDVQRFWYRQGGNPNCATAPVSIARKSNGQETGVDVALATYLFETVEHWDTAVLFCADSDLVPAVEALRRRGKRIYCAANLPGSNTSPLVSACQHFLQWNTEFLRADLQMFEVAQPGGPLDQVISDTLRPERRPMVRIQDHEILLQAAMHSFDGSFANTANGILGPYGIKCDPLNNSTTPRLGFGCRRQVSNETLECHKLVIEGLKRHAGLCSAAQWVSRLIP